MANIKHGTLVADTVTTVTLGSNIHTVEVLNLVRSTDEIYFTVNGSEPTVGGDDCEMVPHQTRPGLGGGPPRPLPRRSGRYSSSPSLPVESFRLGRP